MIRDLDEIVESQRVMLENLNKTGGDLTPEKFKLMFLSQIRSLGYLLKLNGIQYCEIDYHETIKDPTASAAKVQEFLTAELSMQQMVQAVDPSLYRQKKQ